MKNKGIFACAGIVAPWLFGVVYLWILFVVPSSDVSGSISWWVAVPLSMVFWGLFILPVSFAVSVIFDVIALLLRFQHKK